MGKNQRERKARRVEAEEKLKHEIESRRSGKSFWSRFWAKPIFWIYTACLLALIAYPVYGRVLTVREIQKHDEAVIHTSLGDITIKLYNSDASKTAENFVLLSQRGYYNNLIFHRVVKDFMIQGGDPSGDGSGGESAWGGEFDDEINATYLGLEQINVSEAYYLQGLYDPTELSGSGNMNLKEFYESKGYTYNNKLHSHKMVKGSVAMANSGPNTNASQFFIVTGEEQKHLDGKHTVFGEVVSGMDVAVAISEVETDSETNKPISPVTILSIEIK